MARGVRGSGTPRKRAADVVPTEPAGIGDILKTGIDAQVYADFMETCEHLDEIRMMLRFTDEELVGVMRYLAETRGS